MCRINVSVKKINQEAENDILSVYLKKCQIFSSSSISACCSVEPGAQRLFSCVLVDSIMIKSLLNCDLEQSEMCPDQTPTCTSVDEARVGDGVTTNLR